ncbi:Uncharacterised protein [Citrobacter freundii]|nr:Uncharacterised protein [Citrobacter freundii]
MPPPALASRTGSLVLCRSPLVAIDQDSPMFPRLQPPHPCPARAQAESRCARWFGRGGRWRARRQTIGRLSVLIGQHFRCCRQEYPVPKSSAAKRTPICRKASRAGKIAGSPNATDSVSSISRYSAGNSASASTPFTHPSKSGPTWLAETLTASRNGRHASIRQSRIWRQASPSTQAPISGIRPDDSTTGRNWPVAIVQASDDASATGLPRRQSHHCADRRAGSAVQAARARPLGPVPASSIHPAGKRSFSFPECPQRPRQGQKEQGGQTERADDPMLAEESTAVVPASTTARMGRWQGQVSTASPPHR